MKTGVDSFFPTDMHFKIYKIWLQVLKGGSQTVIQTAKIDQPQIIKRGGGVFPIINNTYGNTLFKVDLQISTILWFFRNTVHSSKNHVHLQNSYSFLKAQPKYHHLTDQPSLCTLQPLRKTVSAISGAPRKNRHLLPLPAPKGSSFTAMGTNDCHC